MKRAADAELEVKQEAKKARAAEADPALALSLRGLSPERTWWFVTCGEDGASSYIREWKPPSAKVALAVLHIHDISRVKDAGRKGGYYDLYFAKFMDWWANELDLDFVKPAELGDLERDDLGDPREEIKGGDPGELILSGHVFFYSSWC